MAGRVPASREACLSPPTQAAAGIALAHLAGLGVGVKTNGRDSDKRNKTGVWGDFQLARLTAAHGSSLGCMCLGEGVVLGAWVDENGKS